jgi:hypothetical protein
VTISVAMMLTSATSTLLRVVLGLQIIFSCHAKNGDASVAALPVRQFARDPSRNEQRKPQGGHAAPIRWMPA